MILKKQMTKLGFQNIMFQNIIRVCQGYEYDVHVMRTDGGFHQAGDVLYLPNDIDDPWIMPPHLNSHPITRC